MTKEAFLDLVRRRMNKRPATPHPGRRPGTVSAAGDEAEAGGMHLIEEFRRELTAVGGHAEHVHHPDELRTHLEALRRGLNLEKMVRDEDGSFEQQNYGPWLQAIEAAGFQSVPLNADRPAIAAADVGITLADWGIANTGSIVLAAAPGRPRFVSLLPPVHIALLPVSRLVRSRATVFARLSDDKAEIPVPSNISIITGPSRTADIESDLSIGVHGPGRVHVFMLGEP